MSSAMGYGFQGQGQSESVGAIFLGWLLGVLSPLIVDRIRNRYQEDEIRDGVYSELRELRFTLLVQHPVNCFH